MIADKIRFDLGDVHFVGLSSEYYGYDWTEHIKEQYEWLKKDLSSLNVYYNTQTPTYIVNGCAGNREDHALFDATATPYSAVRSEEYGYMVMKIHNATHIHLQQIAAEKGTFVDNLWITKAPGYRPG
uniref:Metallophos_C domain-containing protein n=1 Tax=Steinernema glaseri TaxID=37863 RepID=A0A1I7YQS9_9BILA